MSRTAQTAVAPAKSWAAAVANHSQHKAKAAGTRTAAVHDGRRSTKDSVASAGGLAPKAAPPAPRVGGGGTGSKDQKEDNWRVAAESKDREERPGHTHADSAKRTATKGKTKGQSWSDGWTDRGAPRSRGLRVPVLGTAASSSSMEAKTLGSGMPDAGSSQAPRLPSPVAPASKPAPTVLGPGVSTAADRLVQAAEELRETKRSDEPPKDPGDRVSPGSQAWGDIEESESEADGEDKTQCGIKAKRPVPEVKDANQVRRQAREADHDARRASTPFARFSAAHRQAVSDAHPKLKFHQVSAELGRRWSALSAEAKQEYADPHVADAEANTSGRRGPGTTIETKEQEDSTDKSKEPAVWPPRPAGLLVMPAPGQASMAPSPEASAAAPLIAEQPARAWLSAPRDVTVAVPAIREPKASVPAIGASTAVSHPVSEKPATLAAGTSPAIKVAVLLPPVSVPPVPILAPPPTLGQEPRWAARPLHIEPSDLEDSRTEPELEDIQGTKVMSTGEAKWPHMPWQARDWEVPIGSRLFTRRDRRVEEDEEDPYLRGETEAADQVWSPGWVPAWPWGPWCPMPNMGHGMGPAHEYWQAMHRQRGQMAHGFQMRLYQLDQRPSSALWTFSALQSHTGVDGPSLGRSHTLGATDLVHDYWVGRRLYYGDEASALRGARILAMNRYPVIQVVQATVLHRGPLGPDGHRVVQVLLAAAPPDGRHRMPCRSMDHLDQLGSPSTPLASQDNPATASATATAKAATTSKAPQPRSPGQWRRRGRIGPRDRGAKASVGAATRQTQAVGPSPSPKVLGAKLPVRSPGPVPGTWAAVAAGAKGAPLEAVKTAEPLTEAPKSCIPAGWPALKPQGQRPQASFQGPVAAAPITTKAPATATATASVLATATAMAAATAVRPSERPKTGSVSETKDRTCDPTTWDTEAKWAAANSPGLDSLVGKMLGLDSWIAQGLRSHYVCSRVERLGGQVLVTHIRCIDTEDERLLNNSARHFGRGGPVTDILGSPCPVIRGSLAVSFNTRSPNTLLRLLGMNGTLVSPPQDTHSYSERGNDLLGLLYVRGVLDARGLAELATYAELNIAALGTLRPAVPMAYGPRDARRRVPVPVAADLVPEPLSSPAGSQAESLALEALDSEFNPPFQKLPPLFSRSPSPVPSEAAALAADALEVTRPEGRTLPVPSVPLVVGDITGCALPAESSKSGAETAVPYVPSIAEAKVDKHPEPRSEHASETDSSSTKDIALSSQLANETPLTLGVPEPAKGIEVPVAQEAGPMTVAAE